MHLSPVDFRYIFYIVCAFTHNDFLTLMSIWSRFRRLLRSIFGGAISSLENPRLILEQNIRELNDQVPKMNENIATVKANVILLQKEERRVQSEVADLTSKVKVSIQAGRDDLAQQHAIRLDTAQGQLEKVREQLRYASSAYDKAQQVKKVFMRERQRKINEAQVALRAHERAKWQSEVADVMEQFEVSGIDQTHDEMIQRIDVETAKNEARMEMALDSIDTQALRIEEDAEKYRAAELVKQFKLEMDLEERGEAQVDIPDAPEKEEEASPKTIGRNRTQG